MPSVARYSDVCTGHDCWHPRANDEGSPNVWANGLQVHRQSDHWTVHCCDDDCHDSHLASGSPTVWANGLQVGRVGDPVACGSSIATGSPNVFAGG